MQDDFGNEIPPLTVHDIRQRLRDGAVRMARIEAELGVVTASTDAIKADTSELVDFFKAMQGAFKVLNWMGNVARPVAAIAALAAALWGLMAAVKGGMPK